MGTNYYLEPVPAVCPTCGHDASRELHIGKSSAGWVFAWRGYQSDEWSETPAGRQLTSPTEWLAYLQECTDAATHAIRDSYGRQWKYAEFRAMVHAKREPRPDGAPSRREVPGDPDSWSIQSAEGDDVLFYEFS